MEVYVRNVLVSPSLGRRAAGCAFLAAWLVVFGCAPQPSGDDAGLVISPAGGTLSADDGRVVLVVPPGAVSSAVAIHVERVTSVPDPPEGFFVVQGTAYRLTPADLRFARPVTLLIRYDAGALLAGASPDDLALYRVSDGGWARISEGSVSSSAQEVSAPITEFGVYAVLGRLDGGGSGDLYIGPEGGTVVAAGGRVRIEASPGAVSEVTPISVTALNAYPSLPPGLSMVAGTAYVIAPESLTFAAPVTLTIAYDSGATWPDAGGAGLYTVGGATWAELSRSSHDSASRTVSAPIPGLGRFAVLADDWSIGEEFVVGPGGGTFSTGDGAVELYFAPGAVARATTVTVRRGRSSVPLPDGYEPVPGTIYEIGPAGFTLGQGCSLAIRYDPDSLPSRVLDRNVRIVTVVDDAWDLVDGGSIDSARRFVRSSLSVLGVFRVLGRPGAVAIWDPALEQALRNAAGRPEGELTEDDLASIVGTLYIRELGIRYLDGIEYCVNLTGIDAESNRIRDLSPLSGLANLRDLVLWHNKVYDASPLASLVGLQRLSIGKNHISDVSPFASMAGLRELLLRFNEISDVTPLRGMTWLSALSLSSNRIEDISALASLTGLTDLYLSSNRIEDVSPLAGLTGLRLLRLDGNRISDVSPLVQLLNLRELQLGDNRLAVISPLVANTGLGAGDVLGLMGNPLDLAPGSQASLDVEALRARGVAVGL